MNIALINPPFFFKSRVGRSHCIGLRIFSSMFKEHGHTVTFLDSLLLGFHNRRQYANGLRVGLEVEDIVARIPAGVDMIGLTVPFSSLAPLVHTIAAALKSRFPHTPLLMGGVYPSTQPQLALTSEADYVVVGEGENVVTGISEGKQLEQLQGVYTRDQRATLFEPAAPVEDLDTLPFPDCSVPHIEQYWRVSPRTRTSCASMITSRGCPFDCEFCSIHPVCGWKWRARSADNVLEEIHYLAAGHNIQMIEIEDDNFTLNRKRTVAILNGIVELNKKRHLDWAVPNGLRIDTLDEETIALMKKSNCKFINIPLEHGDREMLRIMNKKLDVEKAYDVIKLCLKYDIEVRVFVLVGYPGETAERFERSIDFLKRIHLLGKIIIVPLKAQPYPGTRLLDRCRNEGAVWDPYYDNFLVRKDIMNTEDTAFITDEFDYREIERRKERIISVFN